MKVEHETVISIRPGLFRRSLGVRFDMLCFFRTMEELGIKLTDPVNNLQRVPVDELLSVAIFAGAEAYAFHHKEKFKLTKAKVIGWIDDSIITRKHFKELMGLWMEFMATYSDETDKKKQPVKSDR